MGKFTVKQARCGFSFTLASDNGEIIATSQMYSSKAACLNGIRSVQRNAPLAPVEDQTAANAVILENPKFEIFRDKAGDYRFHLKAANGRIIAASQGYGAKDACLKGLDSVKLHVAEADEPQK